MSRLSHDRENSCEDLSLLLSPNHLVVLLMPLSHDKFPCHDAPEPMYRCREELVEVSGFQNLSASVVPEQLAALRPTVLARSLAR